MILESAGCVETWYIFLYHTVENNYIVMSQGVGCGQDSVYSITSHLTLINDQGGENCI